MNEQELAAALFNAGLMTRQQIEAAAAERTPQKNFAQVVVAKGWATPAQILQIDANALPSQNAFENTSFSQPNYNVASGENSPYLQQNQPPIPEPGGFSPAYRLPHGGHYPEAVNGTTVLILGILSLLFCQILGPIAWYMGGQAVRAIDAGRANPAERTTASIGRILGIIGTVLFLLGAAFFLLGLVASVTSAPVPSTF